MTLAEELQIAYDQAKAAVRTMKFDNLVEHDMFMTALFRSACGAAWQKAGRGRSASTVEQSNTPSSDSGCGTKSPDVPAPGTNASIDLAEVPASSVEAGAGAQAFLAKLLSTHALTVSQYTALCHECAVPYPARPSTEHVMRLTHDAVVRVLCGGRS